MLSTILRRPPPLLHISQLRRRRRRRRRRRPLLSSSAPLPGQHLELVRRRRLPQLVEALLGVKPAPGTPPAVPRDEDEGAVPRHPPAAAPDGAVGGDEAAPAPADVEEEACRADDEEGEEGDDDVCQRPGGRWLARVHAGDDGGLVKMSKDVLRGGILFELPRAILLKVTVLGRRRKCCRSIP